MSFRFFHFLQEILQLKQSMTIDETFLYEFTIY